jgi:VanZ family protein
MRVIPALLCTAVILAASSDLFSAAHTGGLLRTLLGHVVAPGALEIVNAALRKLGHVTAYGLHAVLWLRALRGERPWLVRLAVWAVVITFAVAATDEFHQSFIPSRGGSPFDVLLDTCGAALAVLLFRR